MLTIAGNGNNNRVLQSDAATLTITDLTVSGGRIVFPNTGSGAGMLVNGGAVTLQRVVFNDNLNNNGRQMAGDGGGINFIGGNHVVQNSTFSNNRASGDGGGIASNGATLTVSNSTFSNNVAGFSNGGGIFNSGNLDLFNVTISGNTASTGCISLCAAQGGGLSQATGALRMANTIISGNLTYAIGTSPVRPEIEFSGGTFTSLGNNFIGDSAGDSTDTSSAIAYQPTDIRDIPPQLASLGNYGGTTPTRALLSNSPAINAGNDANAPPTDQRGIARVNASDIGAYEYNGASFTISGRVTTDGTNGFSGVTVTLSGSGTATVTTDSNGYYIFTGLSEGGSYTVTPSFPNTVFNPPSATFNNISGSQVANFRPQCTYSISPSSASISANAGTNSFTLTTGAGCSWTAASNSGFISVVNGSGSGSATISYTVTANSGTTARTGTITVAGLTFTVTQAAFPVFSINNVSLFEGNSGTTAFVFTVTLAGSSAQTATVNYATVNGTATPPTDYQATSGSLSFAPGETSKTITVLVNGDTTVEPNENFSVNLSGASNATIANAQGVGTIRNDDGAAATTAFDFNGDGKSDVSVFRPSNGNWFTSQNPALNYGAYQFGQSGDKLVPADYDGDGKTDIAIYRNGNWYLQRSQSGFTGIQFGTSEDIPAPADFDGDGKADLAVFRPSNGTWYLLQSTGGFTGIQFGQSGDKPVVADYDGDGKSDLAVYRPSNGTWYLNRSAQGFIGIPFGTSEDKPNPADYDGDGKADLAVFRPSVGTWYLQQSTAGFAGIQFGANGDLPGAADYDGDGKADLAVFRNGIWYLNRSTQGFTSIAFGSAGDKPVPNAFVP